MSSEWECVVCIQIWNCSDRLKLRRQQSSWFAVSFVLHKLWIHCLPNGRFHIQLINQNFHSQSFLSFVFVKILIVVDTLQCVCSTVLMLQKIINQSSFAMCWKVYFKFTKTLATHYSVRIFYDIAVWNALFSFSSDNEEYTSEPLTMKVGSVSTPYYTIDLK
jgi:hypothetical protein